MAANIKLLNSIPYSFWKCWRMPCIHLNYQAFLVFTCALYVDQLLKWSVLKTTNRDLGWIFDDCMLLIHLNIYLYLFSIDGKFKPVEKILKENPTLTILILHRRFYYMHTNKGQMCRAWLRWLTSIICYLVSLIQSFINVSKNHLDLPCSSEFQLYIFKSPTSIANSFYQVC